MATQSNDAFDAFDAFDSLDESAVDQAPEGPATTPSEPTARQITPEQADLAASAPRKPNKQPPSAKRFAAGEAREAAGAEPTAENVAVSPTVDYGTTPGEAMLKLEEQGFTADEALRLLSVSDRVTHSSEAVESETTLRRLRFTRWLVERGLLSEYPG